MNKLPPEMHLVKGSKGMNQGVTLPESIKQRIPKAEWLDDPDKWNRDEFIEQTSEYLYQVYGIGSDQDKHALAFLAEQIDTYIAAKKALAKLPLITAFNGGSTVGANPYWTLRQNSLRVALQLLNEMGLTPRSRLSGAQQAAEDAQQSKFLRGLKR